VKAPIDVPPGCDGSGKRRGAQAVQGRHQVKNGKVTGRLTALPRQTSSVAEVPPPRPVDHIPAILAYRVSDNRKGIDFLIGKAGKAGEDLVPFPIVGFVLKTTVR
jgi:hypothetical protein